MASLVTGLWAKAHLWQVASFSFGPPYSKHVLWTFRGGGLFRYRTVGESPLVAGGLFQLWPPLLKHVLWTFRGGVLFRYRTLGERPLVAGGLFQLWPLLKHALGGVVVAGGLFQLWPGS